MCSVSCKDGNDERSFCMQSVEFFNFWTPCNVFLSQEGEAQAEVTNVTLVVSKRDGLNLESVSSCLLLFLCSASCVLYTRIHT